MLGMKWLRGLIRRRSGRLLGQSAGVGVAVLLLASLGTFFASSRATMTSQAFTAVPVDWQVQVTPGTPPAQALKMVASAPGVVVSLPVGYAQTTGFTLKSGGSVQTTGPGKVLGVPANYVSTFPGEIRYLVGSQTGVLLAQQTAANLGATVGSSVSIGRPGLPAATLTVTGVVDLPKADSMFQSIGLTPGSGPTAPPDNVMLLSSTEWQKLFAGATTGTTTTQIHVALSSALPADPGAAFAQVVGRAKNLEAALAGGGLVGNNLAAQLDAARSDAIYAELLFLFLGLPGVILAGLLTAVIASSGRDRRRREQALLRIRGASPKQIVRLASLEALVTGLIGALLGLGGAAVTGRLAFGTSRFGATTGQAFVWAAVSVA
ncbi:MAG: ABC transporter permease, partial [Chloroflexota bacterium]|nr:ABC transporter permease [Chloroflexota bacterium]